MLKNKLFILLIFIGLNLIAQSNSLNKTIERSCCRDNNVQSCQKNVCTDNPLCKIYSNQNMCLLEAEIPQELKNLSYVIYPTQFNFYNTERFNFNKRFNVFPHAIIKPENATQVAFVVSVLRKYNLAFSLRSGGHCYGPGSLSSGYIIDLSNFNQIIPNVAKQEVYLGAGCYLGNVIQTLGNINFAIPTGICPSVGLAGLALGGGIGLLSRQYGLTSDSIKSIFIIDANSKIIEVTATNQYADLFWALCGAGGGSYGIVLGFTFKMYYIPKATLVELTFDWEKVDVIDLFQTWQNWIQTLPSDIASEFNFVYRYGKFVLEIISLRPNSAPFPNWKAVFNKFNPKETIISGSYLSCAQKLALNNTQPFSKAKSKFIYKPLPDDAVQVIIDYFNKLKSANLQYLVFVEFGVGGGKLSQGDSAYFPRDAFMYNFQFNYWDFENQTPGALVSISDFYNNFEPYTSIYSYSNLVDYELGDKYLNAYYGTHVDRLVKIKNKYDPLNIFNWKQSIPLKV